MKELLQRKSIKLLLGAFIILTLALTGTYFYSIPSVRETVKLATTVKPEKFTELYFEEHQELPKRVVVDEDMSFRFTIHNLEHKTTEYPYEMYIQVGDAKQTLEKTSVTLKHDEYKTLLKSIKLVESVDRARVVINLREKNQEIAFWVEK